MTLCQLRSRSSPLPISWSVASSCSALPPPPLPVPTPPLDAATQTIPHIAVSQDVSIQLPLAEFSLRSAHPLDPLGALDPPSTHDALCATCFRLVPSLLLDAAVQTSSHSVASHDASTQLPLTEFFIGCIFFNDPLERQAPPPAHCNACTAPPPQPTDIATLCSPSSTSHASDGHEDTTAPRVSPHPPPGLKKYARLCASHRKPVKAAPVRPRLCTSISVTLHSHMLVPPKWEHILCAQLLPAREVLVPPLREPTILLVQILVQGLVLFPKPRALVLPLVHVGQSKPDGHGYINTADSDLMHHQYRLFLLQWNPGPARRNPTNIVSAACGQFHAVVLQEASDHVPHISEQFLVCTGNTNLAILLNKDTFEPDPIVLTYKVDSTSKGTWCMVLLIVRGLLRRPSLSGSPTVAFCSVHIHNVEAKKRDASTELLQRLYGYMREHNVDFIGGDFNMSAFSTVGDVFSDPEFSAPGNSFLWGLGALEEQYCECAGFLIMPKRPYEWRVDSHGRYKYDNTALGLGPRDQTAHLPVFLHLRTTNLPGPDSIMRSEHAQQRRCEHRHNKHERMRRRRT